MPMSYNDSASCSCLKLKILYLVGESLKLILMVVAQNNLHYLLNYLENLKLESLLIDLNNFKTHFL